MSSIIKLETCKGNLTARVAACIDWLAEYQPAFATVRIGELSATIEDNTADGVRAAIIEITEECDIDGEDQWQQYHSTEQLVELV